MVQTCNKVLLLCLVALLLTAPSSYAELISGGAMKGDDPRCNRKDPQNCAPARSKNPYSRGCDPTDRCRRSGPTAEN